MVDYSIQTLYSAGGRIFAGAMRTADYQDYSIMLLEPAVNSMMFVTFRTSLLKGAAVSGSGYTYLATAGSGLLLLNESTSNTSPVTGTSGANFTGLTSVGGVIVGVTGDGRVYSNVTGGFAYVGTSVNYTGALCLWMDRDNQWRPALLLMGVRGKGSTYTHGYQEMVLNNGLPTYNFKTPGDGSPTSVANKAKYQASIGTHPVESIVQLPDASMGGPINYRDYTHIPEWEPPIFASTSKNGLWSYKNGEWNAED